MSKNFEFKRSLNIFKAEFKMRFKGTIIWLALIVGMMAMYMLMYPVIDDIMGEKLALMPEELLQIFGMSKHSVVDNYNSYFAMIYQIIFIILCYKTVYEKGKLIGISVIETHTLDNS